VNYGLPAPFPPCVVAPQSNASACSIVAPSLTKTALDNQSSPLLKTGSKIVRVDNVMKIIVIAMRSDDEVYRLAGERNT